MKKNCTACHCVDKRKYGPSFQPVAAKYADQKNATEMLAKKIRKGGTGVWGQDVMPPQPQVSVAEARKLAAYVMSLKCSHFVAAQTAAPRRLNDGRR